MATMEALQDLRQEAMNESQKIMVQQELQRADVQRAMDAQTKADQAGIEFQQWKAENEVRMFVSAQQATGGGEFADSRTRYKSRRAGKE